MNNTTPAARQAVKIPDSALDEARKRYHIRESLSHFAESLDEPEARSEMAQGWMRFALSGQAKRGTDGTLNDAYRAYMAVQRAARLEAHEKWLQSVPASWWGRGPDEEAPQVDVLAEQRKGRDNVIRSMHANGLSLAQIATFTNLSKSAIAKIARSAEPIPIAAE